MFPKLKCLKEFILIKLLILVVIIGLNPGCTENRIIEVEVEVETIEYDVAGVLGQIYLMEHAYHSINGEFATIPDTRYFDVLWMEIPPESEYTYSVYADEDWFLATAIANIDTDATIDTWTIDYWGNLRNTVDDFIN